MTTTTLAIVAAPTLMDGLVTFLRIGDALERSAQEAGVTVYEDDDGHAVEVEPDPELPAGVLEYVRRVPVESWRSTIWRPIDPEASAARRELLELLANVNPSRDILATADKVGYL